MDLLLEATARAERRHFWFRGFRRFVRPLLAAATEGVPFPRILDCGCGTGANLGLLDRYGQGYGFDLSELGLRLARHAGKRRTVRANVTQIPFPDDRFDVATSFDVLYCLQDRDETEAIAEMYRVLKPGGALIVNVAAMPILHGDHSVLSREVRRYTASDLRQKLEARDFRVIHLAYTNATLFPVLLMVRALQRRAGQKSAEEAGGDIAVPATPVNALFSGLLAVEAWMARRVRFPFGSSLLCLARKPARRT